MMSSNPKAKTVRRKSGCATTDSLEYLQRMWLRKARTMRIVVVKVRVRGRGERVEDKREAE